MEALVGQLLAELLRPPDHLSGQTHVQQQRRVGGRAEGLIAEGDAPPDVAELLSHLGPPPTPTARGARSRCRRWRSPWWCGPPAAAPRAPRRASPGAS